MATNFEPIKCVVLDQSKKTGAHKNKHTESIAKSNTGPPPAPINSHLQPLICCTFW